jgi:hypothetical protein
MYGAVLRRAARRSQNEVRKNDGNEKPQNAVADVDR